MSHTEELTLDTVVSTMRGERFAMLSTATPDGKIVSHPMTPQKVTDTGETWLFIGLQGDQADAIHANPQVNLAFAETGSWLSVAGVAEFVQDRAKAAELWDDEVGAYFEGGLDDPNLGLLRVVPESAQYWGVPGGRVAAALKIAASKITGRESPGVSGTVEL
ncbi:pyridoxamine 5'-phosphate oxidase family protein [Leucobacter rhizosphaerae]|uniref:Pyridoxamine 5'-phosphate oxidase family protein n=1 Tax=Leucobacter rhizosphaerae TaxID=2932245 RepID=A0ABY4FUQ4_9MICO|nr:pyridoxamine 5'-phosphate oxidase family protein [Leucobacter rhizosphaerae]UOQ59993.1 pyridoxamine 5'-phosphate oxidase family protein [Leucobacter rhizosphaerae]